MGETEVTYPQTAPQYLVPQTATTPAPAAAAVPGTVPTPTLPTPVAPAAAGTALQYVMPQVPAPASVFPTHPIPPPGFVPQGIVPQMMAFTPPPASAPPAAPPASQAPPPAAPAAPATTPAPAGAAPPAAAAAPPTPNPTPPQAPPATGGNQPSQPVTGESGEVYHYPANTALAQMTPEQQVEYWRHHARKHEDRWKAMGDYEALKAKAAQFDQLAAQNQTQHERDLAEARRQGQVEALNQNAVHLVEQWMRAAAHHYGVTDQQRVNALVAGINHMAFVNQQTGAVDADKVYQFAAAAAPQQPAATATAVPAANPGQQPATAPAAVPATTPAPLMVPMFTAPPGGPDLGQGQPGTSRPSGLAAGRAIAQQRFGTTPPAQQPAS